MSVLEQIMTIPRAKDVDFLILGHGQVSHNEELMPLPLRSLSFKELHLGDGWKGYGMLWLKVIRRLVMVVKGCKFLQYDAAFCRYSISLNFINVVVPISFWISVW